MKRLLIVTLCAAAAICGCRTVSIEKNEKGWEVSVMSNMMKSEVDGMEAEISPDGVVKWKMGGLTSSPSEEFAKSLMTLTYIARLAAAMYSPAVASVPLTDEAADPQAVAELVKAQAEAKSIVAKAKAEAAAIKARALPSSTTNATASAVGGDAK